MPRSLFVVLLLLLVCCISGYAEGQVTQSETSTTSRIGETHDILFSSRDIQAQTKSPYWIPTTQEQPREFHTPYLMQVDEKLMAIDSATLHPDSSQNHLGTIDFQSRKSSDNGRTWDMGYEIIQHLQFDRYSKDFSQFIQMKGYHPVFVLVESNNTPIGDSTPSLPSRNTEKKQSVLRILEVKPGESKGKEYSMGFASVIVEFPFWHNYQEFVQFVGNTSSPILTMSSGTFVFPVQMISTFKLIASGVMYFKPDERVWRLQGVVPDTDTYNPAVVEWENGKLVMITQHKEGYHIVYESTDLGRTWKESISTLSRVWVNSPIPAGRGSQNNFITATIDESRVILFTQSVETNVGNELHLWLTNNSRIYHVSLISKGQNATTSTLFFRDNKLYCLYEASNPDEYKVRFVDLKSGLDKIKEVLKKWTKQDDIASKGRRFIDEGCTSPNCRIPTTGLVGYLSGNIIDTKWKDEYLCVDADVHGAPTVAASSRGLTFTGVGAGAMWPVSTSGPARQYHFTNNAFTLLATVSIHALPTTISSPLLGVRLRNSKNEVLLGVSYNNDKTWSTINNGKEAKAEIPKWEVDKTYSVVLTFFKKDGKGSVYIDGKLINLTVPTLYIPPNEEISHFYFGVDSGVAENTHMTITNVMLYNRVLTNNEIEVLLRNKVDIPVFVVNKTQTSSEVTEATPNETPENTTSTASVESPVSETATDPQPAARAEDVSQTAQPATPQPPQDEVKEEEETQQTQNESVPVEESETQTVHGNTSENTTPTETEVPVTSTNKERETPLHKTRRNNTTDGTVCVYGYGLPLLLLGLWSLSAALP